MKRSIRSLAAVGAAVSLMVVAAPAASAGPEDAAGCTTTYVGQLGGPYALPNLPTVTYTPPATVTVDADDTVAFTVAVTFHIVNSTAAYVDCVR